MRINHGFIKLLNTSLILMFLSTSCVNLKDKDTFYHPADFDKVKSTCFIWSDEYYEIIPKLIGIISAKDKVTVFLHEAEADTVNMFKTLEKYNSNNGFILVISVKLFKTNLIFLKI